MPSRDRTTRLGGWGYKNHTGLLPSKQITFYYNKCCNAPFCKYATISCLFHNNHYKLITQLVGKDPEIL